MRSYVVLAINANIADANFPCTECNMTKLLQESSNTKRYMNSKQYIKRNRVWIQDTYKKVKCFDTNSVERPPYSLLTVLQ